MPASCRIWLNDPRAPGVGHHVDRVHLVERLDHLVADLVRRLRPDGDDPLVTLLGHEAAVVLLLDVRDLGLEAGEDLLLLGNR